MTGQFQQKHFIEFKGDGILNEELVNTIQPLKKDGTPFVGIVRSDGVAAAIGEFVSEGDPFALNQNLKTLDRSIIRIEHQFGQGGDLRRSVPAVGAMN